MSLKLYTKQPWKTLCLAYKVSAVLLVRVPAWSITYLFTRPRPTWSWRHAMMVALIRHLSSLLVVVGKLGHRPDYRAIEPDAEGIWIGGAPHFITAELKIWSAVGDVTSIYIPGYWYAKKGLSPRPTAPVGPDRRVFLFLHGGGFTQSPAHPRLRHLIYLVVSWSWSMMHRTRSLLNTVSHHRTRLLKNIRSRLLSSTHSQDTITSSAS